jgi:uncharacterized protein (TIGR03437 family)
MLATLLLLALHPTPSYPIRGTDLPPEGWTATALITIRQRLNLNAVRIRPAGHDWAEIDRLVRVANRLELQVVLDADDAPESIRRRVILAKDLKLAPDIDPHLDEDGPECHAFPTDPGAAERLVLGKLKEYDATGVSWIVSSFRPGRLITDYRYFVGTKLDDGWTCGAPGAAGLGMLLLAHLWESDPHGLFAVNGDGGSYRLPIGGRATIYGPTLADAEHRAPATGPLPTRLGNLSVEVTDSRGVKRLAAMLYAAAGWAHINFVVPEGAVPGPAEIAVVRTDGSRSVAQALLGRTAPGLASASQDGRGVAKAFVGDTPMFRCSYDCDPLPIAAGARVRFEGTGFRRASKIRVMVGESEAKVVASGPLPGWPGKDQLTVEMPPGESGDLDVVMWADEALSNVVRIRIVAPEMPDSVHEPAASHRPAP